MPLVKCLYCTELYCPDCAQYKDYCSAECQRMDEDAAREANKEAHFEDMSLWAERRKAL
jgi:hypothetical protein